MKRIIGLALALIGAIAWVSLAAHEQGIAGQAPAFKASHYSSGPQLVTISTRAGQVLSVLDVPAGVELSVHLISGEFTPPDTKTGPVTFRGDASVRTKPRSEIVDGPLRDQMMKAPLKLDVQDAVVVITQNR